MQTGVFFVYVPANQNVILIKIRIVDDKLVEGTEAFGVQLYIPDHHKANGVKLGDPSRVTVLIKDGKSITFMLTIIVLFTATDDIPPSPVTEPPTPGRL